MQAAMKAGDRDGIRTLMAARDGGEQPQRPSPQPAHPPASSREQLLPFGGDMQAAMKAGDRDAIRTLMAARDSKHS
jgi:hypothetical protein